jgi:ankyrin repeat protein
MQKSIKIFIIICCLICAAGWAYILTAKISGKPQAQYIFERAGARMKISLLKRRRAPSPADKRFVLVPGLLKAVKENNIKKAEVFLTVATPPNAFANATSNAPIFAAIAQNNPDMVSLLLKYGANPYRVDENGRMPVHAAIPEYQQSPEDIGKGIEMLKLLFAGGVNIDQRDIIGQTPLMYAARSNKLQTLSFLIENGADINATDNAGHTALETARQFEFEESAALLEAPPAREDIEDTIEAAAQTQNDTDGQNSPPLFDQPSYEE